MSRGRGVQRRRETEEEREAAEQRAKRDAARELGAFLMEADDYRLALIERFGVTALRGQLSENARAYRAEVQTVQREHVRRTMADALKAAQRHPAHSGRIVLYSEARTWRTGHYSVLGDPCMSREHGRPVAVRQRQALRELARLGLPVEYVNPNK